MKNHSIPQIGILVEITREFGRGLCRGVAELARESALFSPFLVDASVLRQPDELRRFDGFIARVMNDRIADILSATGKPVVDVHYEKPRDGFAIVKTRHSRIGRLAAEHFLNRHFSNFAFCGFAGGRFSNYCRAAFAHVLARRGMHCLNYEPDPKARYSFNRQVLIHERLQRAPDEKAILRWLKDLPKPLAVFCPNDLRAWQLLQACKNGGIDVPRQVSILGLDNDVLICGLADPSISSIDPDTEAIGKCAAATLLEILRSPVPSVSQIVRQVEPIGVVTRKSTEVYSYDPPWLSDALVYINRNIAGNISASDVYDTVQRSHTLVDRTFKENLGCTVQAEIARMRLERAKQLLDSTRLSVQEIAPLCGFSSAQYLIRSFSDEFGTPPAAWRNQQPHDRHQV